MEVTDENEDDWVLLLAEDVYIELEEEDLVAGVVKQEEIKSSSSMGKTKITRLLNRN